MLPTKTLEHGREREILSTLYSDDGSTVVLQKEIEFNNGTLFLKFGKIYYCASITVPIPLSYAVDLPFCYEERFDFIKKPHPSDSDGAFSVRFPYDWYVTPNPSISLVQSARPRLRKRWTILLPVWYSEPSKAVTPLQLVWRVRNRQNFTNSYVFFALQWRNCRGNYVNLGRAGVKVSPLGAWPRIQAANRSNRCPKASLNMPLILESTSSTAQMCTVWEQIRMV